jgi:hypothetical protein
MAAIRWRKVFQSPLMAAVAASGHLLPRRFCRAGLGTDLRLQAIEKKRIFPQQIFPPSVRAYGHAAMASIRFTAATPRFSPMPSKM